MKITTVTISKCAVQWCEVHFALLCSYHHIPSPELPHLAKLKLRPHETGTFPSPSAPGNPHSTFCVYEFDCSRYLIEVESHNNCSFVNGLESFLKNL